MPADSPSIFPSKRKERSNFKKVAKKTLDYLQERFGFALWMITRVEENDWVVLSRTDSHYGISEGRVMIWEDSYCSLMVQGLGPQIAPSAKDVKAYQSASLNKEMEIGAYIGVPLSSEDGSLFGTLCALDPDPQPKNLLWAQQELDTIGNLLSALIHSEMELVHERRRADRLASIAERDVLTNLYNRRGWDRLIELEETRCTELGITACAIILDLDGLKVVNDTRGHDAGDYLILKTDQILQGFIREGNIVARLGGDEFGVIGLEISREQAIKLGRNVQSEFLRVGVEASVGCALRPPGRTFREALANADAAMLEDKKNRKASLRSPGSVFLVLYSGNGINSVSPGTLSKRPAFQSFLACSIRS